MRSTCTAIAMASCLALTTTYAQAQCPDDTPRWDAALAPRLTLELRAERLRDTAAIGHGLEFTLWATWDVSKLWRRRPHAPCPPLPSPSHGETP